MSERILVIDDSDFSAVYLQGLLGSIYRIDHSPSGEAGLRSAMENPPDLVLLDVEMPEMDGYEVCRRLRQSELTTKLPVIFLSARVEANDRLAGYEAGGDDYITKPFDPAELGVKLEIMLRNSQKRKSLNEKLTEAHSTAVAAISNVGDIGIIMRFLNDMVSCLEAESVGECILSTTQRFGLDISLQIRNGLDTYAISSQGPCSPLEQSILSKMEQCGRIVDLGSRSAFNFPHISIIVKSMPRDNPELYGRVKDSLSTMAEAAEVHLQSIFAIQTAINRGESLLDLLQRSMQKLREIEASHRMQRATGSQILNHLVMDIEQACVSLGLTEDQEKALQNLVQHAIAQSQALYDQEVEVDGTMRALNVELEQVLRQQIKRPSTLGSKGPAQGADDAVLF